MRVGRHYIGKTVKLQWEDPTGDLERCDVDKAPVGKQALARWVEYGLLDDITDGVVRLRHSEGFEGEGAEQPTEAIFGFIPEVLIISIDVLEATRREAPSE